MLNLSVTTAPDSVTIGSAICCVCVMVQGIVERSQRQSDTENHNDDVT